MASDRIAAIRLERLEIPLTIPYKLAFGPVTAFDTVIAEVIDADGNAGLGEATILTGYTPETIDGCWQAMQRIAAGMLDKPLDAAKASALAHHHDAPFTVTALATAVEMLQGHPVLSPGEGVDVPLLAILSAMDEAGIEAEIARHAAAGYKTIKVKIGWDLHDDLKRTAFIQSCLPDGVSIRIDGNQGYLKEDGVAFASRVDPAGIELLEQPCQMDDWDASAAIAKATNVPFMLDESIYGEEEIHRAAEMGGVSFIKLKLMKAGSLDNLMAQLQLIRDLGMQPVLGNGVAADLGCWMECCVAHRMIDNAGEMNGFLKPQKMLFAKPLRVENGAVRLPAKPPVLGPHDGVVRDTVVLGKR
jgi:L-alanine-DL-glutamate epimerase-like enolase superfamily enzyme